MISVPITLDQLISAIQQLRPEERVRVVQALIESELQQDLASMLQELYAQSPADDITDEEIMAEVRFVRQHSQEK
jgi:hypothetical protein